jgi:hypothetical protein
VFKITVVARDSQPELDVFIFTKTYSQKYPTSIPSSQPTSFPAIVWTNYPTAEPKPIIITISTYAAGIIIIGLVFLLIFIYFSCCTKSINKIKILSMVNEELAEEDENPFLKSKSKHRVKPQ